jgi:hypothetical protein
MNKLNKPELLLDISKAAQPANPIQVTPAQSPRAIAAASRATVAGTLSLQKKPGETPEQAIANAILMPPVLAAASLHHWQHGFAGTCSKVDINQLCTGLIEQLEQVCEGSLRGVKSRLLMQSAVLDSIFSKLNIEAARNIGVGGSLELSERLLKLAFRAQSQSRATDETLAFLEHPKALFIRQQNNAAGHQQVLNSRARKKKPGTNKLLAQRYGERMDTRTPGTSVRRDLAMAAMDAFDRATNSRGKGSSCAQRLSRRQH